MQSLRRIITLCLLGASALPLLAGCGGGGGGNGNTTSPGTTGTTGTTGTSTGTTGTTGTGTGGGSTPNSVSVVEPDGLTASFSENTNAISVGGSVTYTLTLTNNTSATVLTNAVSETPTIPPAVLTLRDPSNNLVQGSVPPPPAIYAGVPLAPGQSLTQTQSVSGFTAQGTYKATAVFDDGPTGITIGPLVVTVQ
jgi:hypothetical protein